MNMQQITLPNMQMPSIMPDASNLPVPPLNLPQLASPGAQAAPQFPGAPSAAPSPSPAQASYPGLKRPPPAVGTTVNGLTYMGGDPRSQDPSVWKPATGDTFLNSLPIDDQKKTLVRSIASYDLPPGSQRGGLGSPEVQQLLALAKQYDPSFSASDYSVRQGVKQDFAKGKYSQTVNALNTAIDHASLLAADGQKLNNTGFPAANWVKNTFDQYVTGDPRQGNFSQVARYLGGEVTKATTGGTGGEADRDAATGDYALNGSPAQQQQALGQTVNVLKSKLDELNATYQKGMGPSHNVMDLLSPSARKSWAVLSSQYGANGPAGAPQPNAAPSPQAPPRSPVRINSDADFNQLPSGAIFVGPDGVSRRKP